MALPRAAYVLVGLFLGAGLGWYYDFAVIGTAVGATCGIWCAIMLHLIDLPSKPSAKSKPLVHAPEQELVKQWTKDEKQTAGNVHDQVAPAQERPTHIQRLKNNRKYLDKSNHLVHKQHKHDKQHEKHENHLQ